jgi:large subunit ribosomal protein L25
MKNKKNTSEEKQILNAQPRNLFGRKLVKLRLEGLLPATVYGPDFKSQSVSVNLKELLKIYKIIRETGIAYLQIDKLEIPVMIKNLQTHSVNDKFLHVDFRKIDLKKKIQTHVPIKTVGESAAVNQKGGVLLTLSENLLVEALPQDIPQKIEIDISIFKDIGQEIKVSDMKKSDKYEIKEDVNKVIVSVVAHKEESTVAETAVTAPEVLTEKAVDGEVKAEAQPAAAPEVKPQPAKKEEKK